jgi:hypothetical protein
MTYIIPFIIGINIAVYANISINPPTIEPTCLPINLNIEVIDLNILISF